MQSPETWVRRAAADADDLSVGVPSLVTALGRDELAIVVVFIPPDVDRSEIEARLRGQWPGTPLVGCTTAGSIGPSGVTEHDIVGLSLSARHFKVATERVTHLEEFTLADGAAIVRRLTYGLRAQGVAPSPEHTFAMLLVDGLSGREELIVSAIDGALEGIPLFGGSAGDGVRFGATAVLADGRLATDSAVVVLVHTRLPFRVFKSQHVEGTPHKFVVTAADHSARTVVELDGEPAARAYARAVGVTVPELTPEVFAAHPVVVRVGGASYVRSIYRRNEDDSLTCLCAIDEGLILTLAEGRDLLGSLRSTLDDLRRDLGPLGLVVGCDCILRRLEATRLHLTGDLGELFREHGVVGFGTYGEQYHGMHVNQTFTGVAIGQPAEEAA